MKVATIRELRMRFPKLKALIAREGEILVTDRGRPAYVLREYRPPRKRQPKQVDYFRRLRSRQPRPLGRAAARALDDLNRGER